MSDDTTTLLSHVPGETRWCDRVGRMVKDVGWSDRLDCEMGPGGCSGPHWRLHIDRDGGPPGTEADDPVPNGMPNQPLHGAAGAS